MHHPSKSSGPRAWGWARVPAPPPCAPCRHAHARRWYMNAHRVCAARVRARSSARAWAAACRAASSSAALARAAAARRARASSSSALHVMSCGRPSQAVWAQQPDCPARPVSHSIPPAVLHPSCCTASQGAFRPHAAKVCPPPTNTHLRRVSSSRFLASTASRSLTCTGAEDRGWAVNVLIHCEFNCDAARPAVAQA